MKTAAEINEKITWQELTPGCNVYEPATSALFNTGDWRTMKPVFHADKCRQCLLCVPVCPDLSIPVDAEGRRGDFNYFYCKGCGICYKVCPFGAIEFVKEIK